MSVLGCPSSKLALKNILAKKRKQLYPMAETNMRMSIYKNNGQRWWDKE